MWSKQTRRMAFTLIELLVVISIIALLIAILLPSLSAAKAEGQRIKSVGNLKGQAQLGMAYSAEEHVRSDTTLANYDINNVPQGIVHPQSSSGEIQWLGLGGWDWGGTDGTDVDYTSKQPAPAMGVQTRPLSVMAAGGGTIDAGTDMSIFQAPRDQGMVPSQIYDAGTQDCLESMWKDKGNSYMGNVLWFPEGDQLGYRFCSFMRPTTMMPDPSTTTLFYEPRFIQAFMSSQEFIDGGAFSGEAVDVMGWYNKVGEFNITFCDGHAARVKVRKKGDVFPLTGYDANKYPNRHVMARGIGNDWRIDCFPAPFVLEHGIGNP